MQPDGLCYLRWQFARYNDANVIEEEALIGIYGQLSGYPATAPDQDDYLAALAQAAIDKWTADVDHTAFSLNLELTRTLAIVQDTAGHTVREQVVSTPTGHWRGSDSSAALPWECALVIGLYTYERGSFVPNARRRRGRVYLPGLPSSGLGSGKSGLLTNTYAQARRDELGAVLSDLVGFSLPHGGGSWHPGILSKVAGQFNDLSHLSVDNKVDVHRSRERQQAATISTVAWP